MTTISRTEDGFVVDAGVIAEAFGITPDQVRDEMRGGGIATRSETGEGADAGRWRMTFFRGDRAFRLVVDAAGAVLSRSSFPIAPRGAGRPPA
ncbi:hypothetical protein EKE94_17750 [Mesobaculum littorinae]|uniref:PepSY domain-containing protein n=1 Tax=Mesobaculum littorinae TaxID=2486419 RepID=A0A438ADG5_9RHOB|nr:DUF6522 family protein [Mesobaculum littorinae]RVV96717.1 hypothetical protein EKE94_17750 [Mesobaculum littorinae]